MINPSTLNTCSFGHLFSFQLNLNLIPIPNNKNQNPFFHLFPNKTDTHSQKSNNQSIDSSTDNSKTPFESKIYTNLSQNCHPYSLQSPDNMPVCASRNSVHVGGQSDCVGGQSDYVSGPTDYSGGSVDNNTGQPDYLSGQSDTNTGHSDIKSGQSDSENGHVDYKDGPTDNKNGHAYNNIGQEDYKSGYNFSSIDNPICVNAYPFGFINYSDVVGKNAINAIKASLHKIEFSECSLSSGVYKMHISKFVINNSIHPFLFKIHDARWDN